MGMGMDGRGAALAAYFQLIRADLRVACKLLTPRVGLPSESLASFMETGAKPAAAAGGGAARVLVVQVLLVEGSGSARGGFRWQVLGAADARPIVPRAWQVHRPLRRPVQAQGIRAALVPVAGRLADALRRHRQDHLSRPCIVRTLVFVG